MKILRKYILLPLACALAALASCNDNIDAPGNDDTPDLTGEAVMFTTSLPRQASVMSRAGETADDALIGSYSPMSELYRLNIQMYEQSDPSTPIGSGIYYPGQSSDDGTLDTSENQPLRWQDNVKNYGFEATAGTDNLQRDQTSKENWLEQDRLHGYAFEPVKDNGGVAIDNIDALNFHTSRDWFAYNKVWMTQTGIIDANDARKVPLFLTHERAYITVRLKAGEGTPREDVDFATAGDKIVTEIFSYNASGEIESFDGATPTSDGVKPWLQACNIDYSKDVNGEAETRQGVEYHAIVEPHNYLANADTHRICKISIAGQNFSFYAGNDDRYADYQNGVEPAKTEMEAYNLKAGDHLVITAILSRATRKVLITAYVEDWTEVVTSSVCDDFGLNGDPITIQNREELIDFLSDPEKNKAGNVAIVSATSIALDTESDPWSNHQYDLNCSINLGGCTFTTSSQFLNDIASTGSLVYGNIHLSDNSTVTTAVCNKNYGSIEYVQVSGGKNAKATTAGIAVVNYNGISNCTSSIPVIADGSSQYIGGIAARSVYETADDAMLPIIFNCTALEDVQIPDGVDNVFGGGIVGLAAGRVFNCTYEYGVSLLEKLRQSGGKPIMLNIINTESTDFGKNLEAYNNQWPTKDTNDIGVHSTVNANIRSINLFDGTIDCQEELYEVVQGDAAILNLADKRYRISGDFSVSSDNGWPLKMESSSGYDVRCEIDGNGRTITLTGEKEIEYHDEAGSASTTLKSAPMLFNHIYGTVHDMNIYCEKSLYGVPKYDSEGKNTYNDGCGTIAYSVDGGKLSNIDVFGADGVFVQAGSPGGLVVSVHNEGTIEDCRCFLQVKQHLVKSTEAARFFGGGITSMATQAKITRCIYYPLSDSKSISSDYTGTNGRVYLGGIVGGLRIYDGKIPAMTISDCSSWFKCPLGGGETNNGARRNGAIIGTSCYLDGTDKTGTTDCQGNWWLGSSVGAGRWLTSESAAIGTKNAVTPQTPTVPTIN